VSAASIAKSDPVMDRLEDQIAWYDRKSLANQRTFRRVKVVEIVAAALIPFLAGFKFPSSFPSWFPSSTIVTGGLGVLVTLLEGLLHLNQYQQNWITYRSTCESLKHDKYLYLANAGPYTTAKDPHALLAERIESTVSQEHARWTAAGQNEKKGEQE
jgi:hypothetical protein